MLEIVLDDDKSKYLPGESVTGVLKWRYEKPPTTIELRLVWKTVGKGNTDKGLTDSVLIERPEPVKDLRFSLKFPSGPYSFNGKLISVLWRIEAVTDPVMDTSFEDLVMSPTGKEIGVDEWKSQVKGFLQN